MSTLSHTSQHPVIRNRLALIARLAGATAALLVAVAIAAGNGSSSPAPGPHPSQVEIERQLESVNGARYGLARPSSSPAGTPKQQLQAVSGARYEQPVGIHAQR